MRLLVVGLALVVACGSPVPETEPLACNGLPALCDRTFDRVVFPTTHNSFAAEDDQFVAANQYSGVAKQLADGVRGLMLDTYWFEDDVWLCHGPCSIGRRRFVDTLGDLRTFLEAHPREVVALLIQDDATPDQTAQAFESAGLLSRLYAHSLGTPWPTLGELVASDRRIVVFAEASGGAPAWYHALYAHAWDNPYAAETTEDFDCTVGRGKAGAPLFLLNHFLTNPVASATLATDANAVISAHVARCESEVGRLPTFVAVDYYEVGELLPIVRGLNER